MARLVRATHDHLPCKDDRSGALADRSAAKVIMGPPDNPGDDDQI